MNNIILGTNVRGTDCKSAPASVLVFFDYENDGIMNHVTTKFRPDSMIHPSSGAGVIQKVTNTYLNNWTDSTKSYFRKLNWQKIMN